MFTLSQIIKPQFVGNSAAALTLVINSGGSTGTTVPNQTILSLQRCRFTNVTASPVTLKVWRVTNGGSDDDQHVAVNTFTVPPGSFNYPYFAWDPGYQMQAGDAIWAIAGTATAISVTGDGGISI